MSRHAQLHETAYRSMGIDRLALAQDRDLSLASQMQGLLAHGVQVAAPGVGRIPRLLLLCCDRAGHVIRADRAAGTRICEHVEDRRCNRISFLDDCCGFSHLQPQSRRSSRNSFTREKKPRLSGWWLPPSSPHSFWNSSSSSRWRLVSWTGTSTVTWM